MEEEGKKEGKERVEVQEAESCVTGWDSDDTVTVQVKKGDVLLQDLRDWGIGSIVGTISRGNWDTHGLVCVSSAVPILGGSLRVRLGGSNICTRNAGLLDRVPAGKRSVTHCHRHRGNRDRNVQVRRNCKRTRVIALAWICEWDRRTIGL